MIGVPSLPMPFEPGCVPDEKQRARLENFAALIGPKGVTFVYTPTNEAWRHTGINAAIGSVLHRGDNGSPVRSKATDWIVKFRSVLAIEA